MKPSVEKQILWMSVLAAVLFSIAGVVLGLLFQSQMILFDGMYSFISVGLSYLSLWGAAFMAKTDWEKYPFGKDMVQPLIILVKYTVILLLVVGSMLAAAVSIFQGGREIQLGASFLYASGAMIACFSFMYYLKKHKKSDSALIQAEIHQWQMDTLVSAAVFAGFLVAMVLQWFNTALWAIAYIDPAMVILVSLYFLQFPIAGMRKALKEVLEMNPDIAVRNEIELLFQELKEEYGIAETFLRVSKTGRTIWVEIDVVAKDTSSLNSLKEQDTIREKVSALLEGAAPKKWLTISFMQDRRWAVEE